MYRFLNKKLHKRHNCLYNMYKKKEKKRNCLELTKVKII